MRAMTFDAVRAVADAVLFEGYALYPHRASALDDQQRWQLGVLSPRAAVEAAGATGDGRRWWLESQCLLEVPEAGGGAPAAFVDGRLRFLHACRREIQRATTAGAAATTFAPTPSLEIGGQPLVPWDEGHVREVELGCALPPGREPTERVLAFGFPDQTMTDVVRGPRGEPSGRVTRRQRALAGVIRLGADHLPGARPLYRLRVRIENVSTVPAAPRLRERPAPPDEAPLTSLIAVHLLLAVSNGAFVSLLEPPGWAREAAAACRSTGTYPVLAGPPGRRDLVLSSPIILHDHPRVAPESPGVLFDTTTTDESPEPGRRLRMRRM